MSTTSIRSIVDDADRRLATASYGEETLAIGVDYFEAVGAHFAGSIYLRTVNESWSDPQINALILTTYGELLEMVSNTFANFGVKDEVYLQRCLDAVERGFLDRGENLFSTTDTGGRA
ncbi:hypothetical protein MKK65_29525 [Methylobacterium sp. J-001]|uniref:hypothetical protein n=1 Tax=Methylobacterium sp. J-001 TaxID=2836609 RepID=UPI001FBAB4D8|nr:hypothetical protein [Methylobacterium sp. J-001]MCJ2120649.1 hypothetical protein [Methylobacterium sp. J-001]